VREERESLRDTANVKTVRTHGVSVRSDEDIVEAASIDPRSDPRWLEFLARHEAATIFHHPLWIQLIQETYHYASESVAFIKGEKLVGILPLLEVRSWLTGRRAICLPFSDYCVPLFEDAESASRLFDHCVMLKEKKQWKYIELRGSVDSSIFVPGPRFKQHRLDLTGDYENVFRKFSKSQTQRSILKAEKLGVVAERRKDAGAVEEFVQLNYSTRKKHGLPPQPDSFFWNLYELLISKNLGFVSTAKVSNETIAAAVFLHYKDMVYYKFGASKESFHGFRPNHKLMWDAIKWGCENGYKLFDFGRTDIDGDGLLRYKRGWGTKESDVIYHRLCEDKTPLSVTGKGVLEHLNPVLRKTPLPVLKVIGRVLYRHVG